MDESLQEIKNQIQKLKKERNAVILAHYYVPGEVQDIADFVGDSYYLSKIAASAKEDVILFCGVHFMGESAKLLSPDKTVLMPDLTADCPMAHMTTAADIKKIREEHPEAAVVCYINSTAEIKAHSDVCVTSSNALQVVKNLPNREIYFIPDRHLGSYVAGLIPEKVFLFNEGFCPIHQQITRKDVEKAKALHPHAKVAAHPECDQEVLALADYIGSTSGIIDYATSSGGEELIVCTETGVFHEIWKKAGHKRLIAPRADQICPDMKKNTLMKVLEALIHMEPEVELPESIREEALRPLERMLHLAQEGSHEKQ